MGCGMGIVQAVADLSNPLQSRRSGPHEVDAALRLVLGDRADLAGFRESAAGRGQDLTATRVIHDGRRIVWAAVPVVSPGRTALLLCPPTLPEALAGVARAALAEVVDELHAAGTRLVQLLAEPGSGLGGVAEAAGFSDLATLAYFVRDVPRRPVPVEAAAPGVTWEAYDEAVNHALFVEVLDGTYAGSLDCPALAGLRNPADILAGHKAAGDHDDALWELMRVDGEPAGLLLLAGVPGSAAAEVVYLGLLAEHRGGGKRHADRLLGRAFHLARRAGRGPITLAADAANDPALRLYRRHGMIEAYRRRAMMRLAGC